MTQRHLPNGQTALFIGRLNACCLVMHKSADVLAGYDLLEVAHDVHVEHVDGQVVLLAHASGGQVHYTQIACQHFVVSDVGKLGGRRVFLGVGSIDAIYARTF